MTDREQQYGSGTEKSPNDQRALHKRRLVRREFLRRIGLATAGAVVLTYARPSFWSMSVPTAYASTRYDGNPSPEWSADDLEFTPAFPTDYTDTTVFTVTSILCNAGDDPGDVADDMQFLGREILEGNAYLDGFPVLLDEGNFENFPPGCRDFRLEFRFTGDWPGAPAETEIKVRLVAAATNRRTGLTQNATLTVTIIHP